MGERRKRAPRSTRTGPDADGLATLLVASDFTKGAAWAAERASRLPLAPGAKAYLLHVLPEGMPPAARGPAERNARRSLDEGARSLSSAGTGAGSDRLAALPLVRTGAPYVEIIRQARASAVELIVLGRHGRRTIRDLFLGSTAERVIRMGSTPALVVNRSPSRPYRRPLVALDLEDTSRGVVDLALRVAGSETEAVEIFHACGPAFDGFIGAGVSPRELGAYRRESRKASASRLARFLESLGDRGVRLNAVVRYGDPRSEILREARRSRADLIVLGTHGRTGISHALLGSVAERIVRAAPCDVLVARAAPVSFELP